MSWSCDHVLNVSRDYQVSPGWGALCCLSLARLQQQPVQRGLACSECCSVAGARPACSSGLGPAKNALEVGHKKQRAGVKSMSYAAAASKLGPASSSSEYFSRTSLSSLGLCSMSRHLPMPGAGHRPLCQSSSSSHSSLLSLFSHITSLLISS